MNADVFEAYFEKIATELKAISHTPEKKRFKRMDIEEVLEGLGGGLDMGHYCLLLESLSGTLEENGASVDIDTQESAFLILKNCEDGNFAQQRQVLSGCLLIGRKIIARLKKDTREGEGLPEFYSTGVKYEKVGPLFDNAYGYRFTFSFFQEEDLSFRHDDWNLTYE